MRTFLTSILIILILSIPHFGFHEKSNYGVDSVQGLPSNVLQTVNEYMLILSTSKNLDECAVKFLDIAGGGLVNPEGDKLRESVKPYSLKKDYENFKFYKIPVRVARFTKSETKQAGYGKSALAGDWFKVYISKKDGGPAAPIHIVVPRNHPTIKSPKVIQIGSL